MNYFAVLKGTLTDITIDLMRRNLTQISDIVRQKFQQDTNFNKTYEVRIVLCQFSNLISSSSYKTKSYGKFK